MLSLLRSLGRQSFASSGIYLLIIALSLAISATTALKFSQHQVKQAVSTQAASMQAADLVLSDQLPIEARWTDLAKEMGLKYSPVTVFSSMAHHQDQFVMVNVKAVAADYPLRGELQIAPAAKQITTGQVWLSQRAMDLLGVQLSDQIQIADASFQVSGVIRQDSNQELGFSAFSPTVIIAIADVAKTNAIQVGSRAEYRLLIAGDAQPIKAFQNQFKAFRKAHADAMQAETTKAEQPEQSTLDSSSLNSSTLNSSTLTPSTLKLRTAMNANVRLMKPLESLDTFLQLANLFTILLCGLAIALSSQRYVQQNQDYIALLRCIGASRKQIMLNYLMLLAVIGLLSTVLGSVLGLGFAYALLQLMGQLIPQLQLDFSMAEMLFGPLPMAILTSLLLLMGFVLPSLWQLLNTAPVRVLRPSLQNRRATTYAVVIGALSLVLFSIILTESLSLSLIIMAVLLLMSVLLYAMVWAILRSIKAFKNRYSAYVGRPTRTALQITALALGLSLISVLLVLRDDLNQGWQQQLPANTPNQFVYGLPPYDLDAFQQQLQAHAWQGTALYPNVRGRLVGINGKAFSPALVKQNNALRRELNLTQSAVYPSDNQIVSGHAVLAKAGEVSVEAKLATELGIHIGDRLEFSLPEGKLEATVVNLRSVEWQSFSPNFFFIFAPNSLDENAGSYLGSFYVPPEQKPQLIALIRQFSQTVFVDVSLILDEIKALVNVLAQIITLLAVLVSISGILVLIACLNLMMDARKREVALLRSFGSSKAQLRRMMSVEIGLMGLVAGIVACLFAEVISAIVAYRMHLPMRLHGMIWLLLPVAMAIICALIGRYRLGYLAELPPLKSLRELSQ